MFEVKYVARPSDVQTGFWMSWHLFPGYRIRIIVMGIITALLFGFIALPILRSLLLSMVLVIIIAVVYPAFLSILASITTKKNLRHMNIGVNGISTTIGKSHGEFTWDKFTKVFGTDTHIFIIGKNLNLFTIPNRAFNTSEEKNQCLEAMQSYLAGYGKTKAG